MATPLLGSRCANRGSGLKGKEWFERLPRLSVDVECSGSSHKVTWDAGELTLHDHDVEAEKTLSALGGEPAYCLSLLEAWMSAGEDDSLEPEILLNEDLDWALQLDPKMAHLRSLLQNRQAVLAPAQVGVQRVQMEALQKMYEQELKRHILFAAPFELRKILGLARIAHMAERWESDKHFRSEYGLVLEGVLTRRVIPDMEKNVASWNPKMTPHAITTFECWPLKAHEEPSFAGSVSSDGGFAIANVLFSWLHDVWHRGISIIDDCFILEASPHESDHSKLRLLAVRWERFTGRSVPVVSSATGFCGSDGVFHLSWGS